MMDRRIRRKFGQNYLKDPAILFEMGEAITPIEGDYFFEIGPGMGALTNTINNNGINIHAMDIDPENIKYLSNNIGGPSNITFEQGDIMNADLDFIRNNAFRIIGNLPYNISTQIILRLLEYHSNIKDMHFLVQREVAEKISGSPSTKNWGKLSLKIGSLFNCRILFDVPPDAFDIKPKVNSSFIRLTPKLEKIFSLKEKGHLFRIIDMAFVSRRKNIQNNLKKLNIDWSLVDIDPKKRPEDLQIDDYIKISKNIKA